MSIAIGDRVDAGDDTGDVMEIAANGSAHIGWDSGTSCWLSPALVAELTILPPAPLRGANLAVNEGTPHA